MANVDSNESHTFRKSTMSGHTRHGHLQGDGHSPVRGIAGFECDLRRAERIVIAQKMGAHTAKAIHEINEDVALVVGERQLRGTLLVGDEFAEDLVGDPHLDHPPGSGHAKTIIAVASGL